MGEIVYYNAKNRTKLYINIIDKYQCTNNCIFCDKLSLEKEIGSNLFLLNKPTLNDILSSINKKLAYNIPDEFVFCGIGEPTIYLDTLIEMISELKSRYIQPIRLNSNGQAYSIHPNRNVPKELKKAGLDVISISLNAINSEEYNQLHRPKYTHSFESILKFIQDSSKIGLNTYISFIEFGGLDKQKVLKFIQDLNLKNIKIRFRKFIN